MSAMSLLLESTLQTSIVVVIALTAAALFRRRSAALRHWILASAIVCAALTPALGSIVPSWRVAIGAVSAPHWIERSRPPAEPDREPRAEPGETHASTSVGGSAGPALPSASHIVAAIWMAGAGTSLLILVAGFGRLAWIASHARRVRHGPWATAAADVSREYGLRRQALLLQTMHPGLLVTWGLVQPKVLLPRTASHWSEDRVRIVLFHELAHIKRRDWLIQMVAEIVRALHWFNPLVWIVCARLRQESEHATDDTVLAHGASGSDYAAHLLDLARVLTHHRRAWVPAPAIARPSSLERRVTAMLNDRTNRMPATRSARIATLGVALSLAVALAAAQTAFATFSGTVFDETNSFVPGATLMLTNPQSRAKYEVVSDRTGHFEFVGLPPGDYQLETQMMGFAPLRGTLTLSGQNARRDLVLQVGSLQETITVSGGPTTTDRSSGTVRVSTAIARRPDPTCSNVPAGGMGGNIRAPWKIKDVKPTYPQQLSDANIGGTVVLQARIDTEGRINSVEVVSPLHPDLDSAAIEAVRQWEFDSTILNCTKVEVPMRVTVNFVARP
jgi:TonB family protein